MANAELGRGGLNLPYSVDNSTNLIVITGTYGELTSGKRRFRAPCFGSYFISQSRQESVGLMVAHIWPDQSGVFLTKLDQHNTEYQNVIWRYLEGRCVKKYNSKANEPIRISSVL
jgi:hypothetical protein